MPGIKNCEITVSLAVGPAVISIKSTDNLESLGELLDGILTFMKDNREKLKIISESVTVDGTSSLPRAALHHSQDYRSNNFEIVSGSVMFTSKKAFDLATHEAIALVMYAFHKPLSPGEINKQLTQAWKKVSNVSTYLTNPRYLKASVVNTDDGYILTGAGRNWVEREILPKLADSQQPE